MTDQQRGEGRTHAHDTLIDAMKTRRRFLAGTAAIGATALAGCSGSGSTPDDGGNGNGNGGGNGNGSGSANADVDVLNYALTLEHLEHAFYRDGLEAFSGQELPNADTMAKFDGEIRGAVPARLDTVRAHEKGHVDALTGIVSDLGGDPVGEAEYTFEFDSATKFIAAGSVLENTGVAAYKGAAPAVKSNDILASALGIHGVEVRHASYLNALDGKSPYPDAVDEAMTVDEVPEAADPFFADDVS